MAKMRVRKVKRKCNVLGCRCIDTYALTATSEYGSSVVICEGCLRAALECIDGGRIEGLPKGKTPEKEKTAVQSEKADEPISGEQVEMASSETEAEQNESNAPEDANAEEPASEESENKPEGEEKPKKNFSAKSKKVK